MIVCRMRHSDRIPCILRDWQHSLVCDGTTSVHERIGQRVEPAPPKTRAKSRRRFRPISWRSPPLPTCPQDGASARTQAPSNGAARATAGSAMRRNRAQQACRERSDPGLRWRAGHPPPTLGGGNRTVLRHPLCTFERPLPLGRSRERADPPDTGKAPNTSQSGRWREPHTQQADWQNVREEPTAQIWSKQPFGWSRPTRSRARKAMLAETQTPLKNSAEFGRTRPDLAKRSSNSVDVGLHSVEGSTALVETTPRTARAWPGAIRSRSRAARCWPASP